MLKNELKQWLEPLKGDSPPLYVVGGAVRDHFLSRVPKDVDLMCQGADTMARRVADTRNAAVVPFQKNADEPCFRVADRGTSDSFIDIALMRGDTVIEDLNRRDFTINAIAIQVEQGGVTGDIIDPLDGVGDIKQRLIRMTSPDALISDPLRILRAVRFAASLDFTIEEATLAAMRQHAPLMKKTANERILAELLEIFKTGHSIRFVQMMDELGILEVIFPEIIQMKGCTQNTYHHLDVWNHSLLMLEHCEYIAHHPEEFFGPEGRQVSENLKPHNRLPLLKLAAMLHDVGKPETRGVKEDGRITFYGHEQKGAEMVSDIAFRLRLPNQAHEFVRILVAEHINILSLFFSKTKPTTRMRWFRKVKDDCIPLIIMGMADIRSTLGPAASEERGEKHLRWSQKTVAAYYGKIKKQLERRNLISGDDLIARGMTPGPEMGRILKQVRNAQDAGQVTNREEALALAGELAPGDKSSG